jgi:exodeoxyribonuclease V alpha subunit
VNDTRPLPAAARACLDQLESWVQAGWLRDLDLVFAQFLAREAPDAQPQLLLAAALASHQLGRGHVCLDLQATLENPGDTLALPPDETEAPPEVPLPSALLTGLDVAGWRQALQHEGLVGGGPGTTPLVLEGTRLYLRRYWQHEQSVRAAIDQRLAQEVIDEPADAGRLREALAVLFPRPPGDDPDGPDWQKIACALAARSRFGIVTGGPGTGKTTTVVKLLAVLQHLAPAGADGTRRRLRIRLAAPTGKAAARLNESIARAVESLPLEPLPDAAGLRAAIPTEVVTVHRLLVTVPGTRRFRHHALNPLPLDVLVLDEASMVSLETMAAVLAALPAQARVVLLGDKDQLASVEAGGLLGELCRRADAGHYRPATAAWLRRITGETVPGPLMDDAGEALDQAVVKLRKSHRFSQESGIGRLAEAVNAGDLDQVRAVRAAAPADLAWIELASEAPLRRLVLDGAPDRFPGAGAGRVERGRGVAPPVGYRHYLQVLAQGLPPMDAGPQAFDAWAESVLAAYGRFQLLCAVRRGKFGVQRLNQRIAALLHAEQLTPAAEGWYLGRPVMVTQNDYALGLMNGDIGITLQLPVRAAHGATAWLPRVAFATGEGGIRWVLPSRLQAVETVYAMTVHKSQGSEFTHAALVLPDRPSRVLTRELVYTGITRAREWFTTVLPAGGDTVLDAAVLKRVQRAGGLFAPE